ncbi:MAG: ral secretion pathway protein, partial [Sphingomonas bacterium]|nr:ral secretion pathway protein [Sphingomonas bacterium]
MNAPLPIDAGSVPLGAGSVLGAARVGNLPYAFARRFGVAIADDGDAGTIVALREGADPKALIEVRRVLGRRFAVERAGVERFDRILSERYAMDGQAA